MAASIGALITTAIGLTETGATVIVGSITVNTVVGTIALAAANFAVNSLMSGSGPKGEQQFTVRQPIPPRREYDGRNKAGGYYFFMQSKDGSLYQGILQACHEITRQERWIGDRLVTFDESGLVNFPDSMTVHGDPVWEIHEHDGTADQVADPTLLAAFSDGGVWTEDHRLRGIAYTAFVQRGVSAHNFSRYYPGGAQSLRTVFDGARVPDPRNPSHNLANPATWAIGGDNAAGVILRFLIGPNGWGMDSSVVAGAIDDWKQAATDSDVSQPLKNGGSDKKYRLVGSFDLTAAPKDTMASMLSACDGYIYMKPNGAIGFKVGKWEDPTVVLDERAIIGYTFTDGGGVLTQANELVGQFIDPNNDYQPVQAEAWRDEDNIALLGEVLSKPVDTAWCPTHNQVRRILKRGAEKANPVKSGTITCNHLGLDALGERRVTIRIADRNINAPFEIVGGGQMTFDPFSITFQVQQVSALTYDFDAETEEGDIPAPPASTDAGEIEQPQNPNVDVVGLTTSAGITTAHLSVSCDAPSRTDLQLNVEFQVQTSITGWTAISIADGELTGLSPGVPEGTYDLRFWFVAPGGTPSEYSTFTGVIVYFGSGSTGGGPLTVVRDENGAPVKDDTGAYVTVS